MGHKKYQQNFLIRRKVDNNTAQKNHMTIVVTQNNIVCTRLGIESFKKNVFIMQVDQLNGLLFVCF